MLTNDILSAVKSYTENMDQEVTLVLQTGEHPKRDELKQFLTQLCGVSDKLRLSEADHGLRSPISFGLEVNGEFNGVYFSGIPSGHEFNSLILAILQSAGAELKLDASLVSHLQSPHHRRLLKAIRLSAGALELELVLDGVNTQEQKQQLAQMGFNSGQGQALGSRLSAADSNNTEVIDTATQVCA